jgi:hypothetical protein
MIQTALVVGFGTLTLAGSTGCPSEKTCQDYSPPASFDPQTPTASLRGDVMPVFSQSCTFTSCHGSNSGSNNGVYLGDTDPQKLHDALVSVAAVELPSMPYITPGDARQSYLMRKLDGSHCVLDAQCVGGSCGEQMPNGAPALDITTRDAIRRWILQGAKVQ